MEIGFGSRRDRQEALTDLLLLLRQRRQRVVMAFPLGSSGQRAGLLWPRRGVPDPRRLVVTRGEDALAVAAERHAEDNVRVSPEGNLLLPRLGVPEPRRAVVTPGEDALAVGAERHAGDLVRVSLEDGLLLPRLGIPDRRLSQPAVTMRVPSGLNAMLLTNPLCPLRTAFSCPVSASKIRAGPTLVRAVVRTRRPSGLNANFCPRRASISRPVSASQTRTLLSVLSVRTRLPSGLNPTLRAMISRPLRAVISRPVSASHSRDVG